MTVLKLLGPAWSRAFRCVWMLEELGVPYELVSSAMPASRQVRKYNRTGKIPVLLEYDKDTDAEEPSFVLYESVAINTYLADKYAGGRNEGDWETSSRLVPPAGTRQRAIYDQMICCILSELDAQGVWIHRKHEALGKHFGHIPEAVKAAELQFARVNQELAQSLNPYLLGEQFTAADILYVHCLDWSKAIGWSQLWPDNVSSYRDMCHERPAYQRAKALRDAERNSAAQNKPSIQDSKM